MIRVLSIGIVTFTLCLVFPVQTEAQSIYVDVSNSGPRGVGVGLGGALQVASLGFGDIDAYAGVRNYFVDQENTTAIGIQAGLDLILPTKIVDTGVVVRPVIAVGVDWERQKFDNGTTSDSSNDVGILVAAAVQATPKGTVLGIPLFGDIGVVRTLFHDNNVTEFRARLHVLLRPSLVRDDHDDGD